MLADELLASDLPDDPYLRVDLLGYFPSQMRPTYRRRWRRTRCAARSS